MEQAHAGYRPKAASVSMLGVAAAHLCSGLLLELGEAPLPFESCCTESSQLPNQQH